MLAPPPDAHAPGHPAARAKAVPAVPHWYLKAAIQGVLSRLPEPQRWNRFLQRYATRSLHLEDAKFLQKWRQCERHLAAFRAAGGPAQGFVALELGTGWVPIVPLALALAGAQHAYTIDTQPLLRREQLIATLRHYQRHLQTGALVLPGTSAARALERITAVLERPSSVKAIMRQFGVELLLTDARRTGLPAGHVDLFVSNNTLEHIPREILVEIFCEFRRLAASRAVMSHFIDLADHYAGFDPSITVFNFLRFSEPRWRWFNNALQYQNRLRVPDFRRIHAEAGWEVVSEDNACQPVEVLRSVPLAKEFRHYREDDLLVSATWMSSRPRALI